VCGLPAEQQHREKHFRGLSPPPRRSLDALSLLQKIYRVPVSPENPKAYLQNHNTLKTLKNCRPRADFIFYKNKKRTALNAGWIVNSKQTDSTINASRMWIFFSTSLFFLKRWYAMTVKEKNSYSYVPTNSFMQLCLLGSSSIMCYLQQNAAAPSLRCTADEVLSFPLTDSL